MDDFILNDSRRAVLVAVVAVRLDWLYCVSRFCLHVGPNCYHLSHSFCSG